MSRRISRRGFLAGGVAGAGLALLRLCQEARPVAARSASRLPATSLPVASAASVIGAADLGLRQVATPTVQPGVTLRWLLPAHLGYERSIATSFVQDFERETPGIRVEVTFEPEAGYEASLAAALTGDAPPDIVQVWAHQIQELGLRGLLHDLGPQMQRSDLSPSDFFPFLIQQVSDFRRRTRLWAVPKDSAIYVIYYNKTHFDRAGVPYPRLDWTLDEFRLTARQLTVDRNGNPATSAQFDASAVAEWGLDWGSHQPDMPLPGSDLWQSIAWGQAGPWFSDDLTRVFLDDAAHVTFLERLMQMRCHEHSIRYESEPGDPGGRWRQGTVAMSIAHYAQSHFYDQEQRTFAYDIVPAPSGPHGQFNASTCSGWSIPVGAAHRDEAWEFIRFLVAPSQQQALVNAKRWGPALKASAPAMLSTSDRPASLKATLYDPMFGQSAVQVRPLVYPPFLDEMRRVWQAELGSQLTCGAGDLGEAAKRAQPQIQAVLDRAWSL